MSQTTDYSKWDRLEISDDEKEYHPNIDASLMIRIRREQRAKREAEEAERIAMLEREGTPESLARAAKIKSQQKLHVGNICKIVDEKTIIKSASDAPIVGNGQKPIPSLISSSPTAQTSDDNSFSDFMERYESTIADLSVIESLADSENYMYSHPEIYSDHACGLLLLQALNLEMAGRRKKMLNAVRQYLILKNVLDLGKEAGQTEEFRPMVKLFFKTIQNDETKRKALEMETVAFAKNIEARAVQKKMEMADDHEAVEDEVAETRPE